MIAFFENPTTLWILLAILFLLFLAIALKNFLADQSEFTSLCNRYLHKNYPGRSLSDHLLHNSEKRHHPRLEMQDTKVNVTDGYIFCTALLVNISPLGVCLKGLPENLFKNTATLTLFAPNTDLLPILRIEPRWEKRVSNGKAIGAAIVNPSDSWTSFYRDVSRQPDMALGC